MFLRISFSLLPGLELTIRKMWVSVGWQKYPTNHCTLKVIYIVVGLWEGGVQVANLPLASWVE